MVSGFLGKELLRKELRVRISCSPLYSYKSRLLGFLSGRLFFVGQRSAEGTACRECHPLGTLESVWNRTTGLRRWLLHVVTSLVEPNRLHRCGQISPMKPPRPDQISQHPQAQQHQIVQQRP